MKVKNMLSVKSGREVANQFELIDNEGNRYFQSYSSIIVQIQASNGQVFLDKNFWNYSRTTAKYRNMFLRETTQDIKLKIHAGFYILADLNR
ncbi:MAG: hypothetical protein WCO07_01450 [bacterium]